MGVQAGASLYSRICFAASKEYEKRAKFERKLFASEWCRVYMDRVALHFLNLDLDRDTMSKLYVRLWACYTAGLRLVSPDRLPATTTEMKVIKCPNISNSKCCNLDTSPPDLKTTSSRLKTTFSTLGVSDGSLLQSSIIDGRTLWKSYQHAITTMDVETLLEKAGAEKLTLFSRLISAEALSILSRAVQGLSSEATESDLREVSRP